MNRYIIILIITIYNFLVWRSHIIAYRWNTCQVWWKYTYFWGLQNNFCRNSRFIISIHNMSYRFKMRHNTILCLLCTKCIVYGSVESFGGTNAYEESVWCAEWFFRLILSYCPDGGRRRPFFKFEITYFISCRF